MNTSRKKKAFRPGGYDALEERVVLSTGGAREAIRERLRSAAVLAGGQSSGRRQLATRPLGLGAQLGRRQFTLRGGANGAGGANLMGFSPLAPSLGFADATATRAAPTGTNTISSVVGPNVFANTTGFDNTSFNVNTLAQSLAGGANINNLGLNNGSTTFNGSGLGNGFFRNGLGFINAQSVVGNLASSIDPGLGLTTNALNRGLLSFGGLGANNGTFGLANALRNSNRIGFNGGLGLNNGLGFSNTQSTTTLGNPLSNRLGFNALGLNRVTRSIGNTIPGTDTGSTGTGTGIGGTGTRTGTRIGGTGTGTGTGVGSTIPGTGTGTTGTGIR